MLWYLFVCGGTAGSDAASDLFSSILDPAVCLAIDMLVASRGESSKPMAAPPLSRSLTFRPRPWPPAGCYGPFRDYRKQIGSPGVAALVLSRQDLPEQPWPGPCEPFNSVTFPWQ